MFLITRRTKLVRRQQGAQTTQSLGPTMTPTRQSLFLLLLALLLHDGRRVCAKEAADNFVPTRRSERHLDDANSSSSKRPTHRPHHTSSPTSAPTTAAPNTNSSPYQTSSSPSPSAAAWFASLIVVAVGLFGGWILCGYCQKRREIRMLDERSRAADRVLGDMQMIPQEEEDDDYDNEII